jgi:predicted alpha/beta hydrolase
MANLYTIEDLLIGKLYRSKSLEGEIVEAEKHPASVYYADAEAYLIRVRKSTGMGGYYYRTIAVKVGE